MKRMSHESAVSWAEATAISSRLGINVLAIAAAWQKVKIEDGTSFTDEERIACLNMICAAIASAGIELPLEMRRGVDLDSSTIEATIKELESNFSEIIELLWHRPTQN